MSKIVDALRKLQDDRYRTGNTGPNRPRKIARLERDGSKQLDDTGETVVIETTSENLGRVIQLDRSAMLDAGLIAPEAEAKVFEDEYRVIKRPILSNAFGQNASTVPHGHIVLVSSALAGDGKTFTCINLALSLARERDTSVLLIDADLPKPHISSLFDASDEAGLLDYLDGSVTELGDIELQTSVEGLTILPAGRSREDATELLSSHRMRQLLDLAHRRNPRQVVLIDSSPLLQTTEARALAAVAGQVVLVVHAGITPKDSVLDAIAIVDTDKPTNLVLNQMRFGRGSGYYKSYYGDLGSNYGETDVSE